MSPFSAPEAENGLMIMKMGVGEQGGGRQHEQRLVITEKAAGPPGFPDGPAVS
ncbi:MAG TPA: hypothetical protein VGO94_13625 [Mycobacteriales bacterium]|nr:hypothetical protein [Mycobacteriales bacterium]